jgi:hypothetical protein
MASETSISELAYAVYIDGSREGVKLGGVESLQRYLRLKPQCPDEKSDGSGQHPYSEDIKDGSESWRFYCDSVQQTDVQGNKIKLFI